MDVEDNQDANSTVGAGNIAADSTIDAKEMLSDDVQ